MLILTGLQTLLGLDSAHAQVSAIVDLSKRSVYVQQPFRVNITVYTKTWFTQPLEFTNLQIPNAFIVPFDKTQPGMFTIGGKQYPGVQFYYIVFPYKPGEFSVPSLEITAQSPPEGSSESRKVIIHTTEQKYTVKDVPKSLKDKGDWLVAKNVILRETWSPDLKNLKVGDVLKRTVTIDAQGTLPQFIPDISGQEQVKWASTYPQSPVLTDTRGGGDANGRSTQTTTYLLEKSGNFIIPGIELPYWNPYSGKLMTASTIKHEILVADNPDLGILTTLKDSLDATQSVKAVSEEKTPFLILGMKWYQFAGLLIIALFVCYCLFSFGRKVFKKFHIKWLNYLNSEQYLFRKMIHSNNSPESFLPALYKWWDNLKKKPSSSIGASLNEMHLTEEEKNIKNYLTVVYEKQEAGDAEEIKKMMRKRFKHKY